MQQVISTEVRSPIWLDRQWCHHVLRTSICKLPIRPLFALLGLGRNKKRGDQTLSRHRVTSVVGPGQEVVSNTSLFTSSILFGSEVSVKSAFVFSCAHQKWQKRIKCFFIFHLFLLSLSLLLYPSFYHIYMAQSLESNRYSWLWCIRTSPLILLWF